MAEQLIKRGDVWYFRYTDADGVRRMRKGCTDKRETERMAAAAGIETAKIKSGLIDPRDLVQRTHEAKPLASHVADWHAYLLAKGSTRQHADLSRNRISRIIELARLGRISELTPSKVQAALKAIRDTGVSLRSIHHYTRASKGFSRWLWRDGRAREDTLAHLTSQNPDADRRRIRRALEPEELVKAIRAAEQGRVVLKTTGPDRAMLYQLAMGTGFRANELRTLTPEAFDLAGDQPTITVKAAYSKRRRDDVQPIQPELADALRPWLAARAPGKPLFGKLTKHTANLLKHDLEAAGIPYETASGTADFYCLRHSYVTALAMSNAPVKVVQSLARHSTPSLTFGIYAHVGLHDQAPALDALPDLTRRAPSSEPTTLAKTGTDPTHVHTLAPSCIHSGDVSSRDLSGSGVMVGSTAQSSMEGQSLENKAFDASSRVQSATGGTEGVGFEPTVGLHLLRFSRPSQSTTLAPLRRSSGL